MRVHVEYQVAPGPDAKALVTFIAAHATSVIRQHVTRQLEAVTTSAELSRQRAAIRFATRQHYTVPPEPIVRIVSVARDGARNRQVGMCLWLPSTEYVDAATGRLPSGDVPQAWVQAIAILQRQTVTWKVDRVSSPTNPNRLSCGGTP